MCESKNKFTGVTISRTLEEQDDINDILKKIEESGSDKHIKVYFPARPNKANYYLGIAKAVSKRSACLKRRYGCVIVNNDEIIATGYNGNPRGEFNCCDIGKCYRLNVPHNTGDYSDCHSVHAEQNAMLSAARRDMLGAEMYLYGEELVDDGRYREVNAEPCPICSRMIKNSGISIVRNASGVINLSEG